MKNRISSNGFTLIELMIVLVIVSILASIAFPAYMSSVKRSNRAEAKTELNDVAQRLQRCFTTNGSYIAAGCLVYTQLKDAANIVSRGRGFYRVTISNDTATTYTLTATAILEPQTGDNDVTDCRVLTLTELGVQGPVAAVTCW
jgi:type IV pilus assembly protein PilE